jgi:2-succinyl-5-enolpyruvyl-6-hydroxy-3-cyclohexene-1-carboxylate synthase
MHLQRVYDIAEICAQHRVTEAVVCPGSRCAPITIAFVRHPKINVRTISDERSAAFIALGIAQEKKEPVALVCTSGSAAYNFAPAVAEAYYQQTPLIILTADRPSEWISQRDGQTIVQQNIYGTHVKSHCHLPEDTEHPDARWNFYRLVNESISSANQGAKGPVHLNVPLREPLYPQKDEVIQFGDAAIVQKISWLKSSLPTNLIDEFRNLLAGKKKVLIVVGQEKFNAELHNELNLFFKNFNVPVIGDITSNLHPVLHSVLRADSFLVGASEDVQKDLRPDVLISFGKSTVSKNLKLLLRKHKAPVHWHLELGGNNIIDPFQSISSVIPMEPVDFFRQVNLEIKPQSINQEYCQEWLNLEKLTHEKIHRHFSNEATDEFSWVYQLIKEIPDDSNLHLANSLAVRYANWIGLSPEKKKVNVYANRGTSGIDGCTSTAVGHALASSRLNILLTGDLAFFYDRNAFWNNYPIPNLRVVLLNNHGGAIFGVIDGPGNLPEGNDYFITSQHSTAEWMAKEFNLGYQRIAGHQNQEQLASIWKDFFAPGTHARILEIESDAAEAKKAFSQFKENIKHLPI